jgi:hypothetical protein
MKTIKIVLLQLLIVSSIIVSGITSVNNINRSNDRTITHEEPVSIVKNLPQEESLVQAESTNTTERNQVLNIEILFRCVEYISMN